MWGTGLFANARLTEHTQPYPSTPDSFSDGIFSPFFSRRRGYILKDNHINCYFQKEQLSIFDTEGKENPYLTIMTAVLGTAAELERQSIYYRLKSGLDKYIRDGGKVGKPKGAGIKDKAQLASEYKSIIRCLRSGESVRHTALITGYSQSTVQRVKKVFSL